MIKAHQINSLQDCKHKLLSKKSRLLQGVVKLNHDDFEALLQIFDSKLKTINDQLSYKS